MLKKSSSKKKSILPSIFIKVLLLVKKTLNFTYYVYYFKAISSFLIKKSKSFIRRLTNLKKKIIKF